MLRSDLHVAPVDFIDDLEVPGQQGLEQVNRPAFQSLRQHSVVGVGTCLHTDVPCLRGGESQHTYPVNSFCIGFSGTWMFW